MAVLLLSTEQPYPRCLARPGWARFLAPIGEVTLIALSVILLGAVLAFVS